MKKFILSVCAALLSSLAIAQETRTIPRNQIIKPYQIEVTFSKTVHILFPAPVKYVDLGSTNIIAGMADRVQNVVRVKAAVKDFTGETNFSVVTEDGVFFSFNVSYAEEPAQLNIEMDDWLHKNPYDDFANDRMFISLKELGNETPLIVNRMMYSIHKRNANDVRSINSKKFGMQASIRGIYIANDLMYLHLAIRNSSNVSFDIDNVRFKIVDKKVTKRTAIQETFIEPVRVFNDITKIEGKSVERNVYAFPKITIPDDKVLVIEIFEHKGGRHQILKIKNSDLVGAKPVRELNIR